MSEFGKKSISPEEQGVLGDRKIAQEIVGEIKQKWAETAPGKNPFALMIGGFQGSGKTTTLELIKDASFVVVSPDEIRFKLFEKEYYLTDETRPVWVQTVNLTRNMLIEEAIFSGRSVAIDEHTTQDRINLVQEMLKEKPDYRLLTILLSTPKDELRRRVGERPRAVDKYTGTLGELEGSIKKHGEPDLSLYDLVIDTSVTNPEQTAEQIKSLMRSST